jgi:hypothetical protein
MMEATRGLRRERGSITIMLIVTSRFGDAEYASKTSAPGLNFIHTLRAIRYVS